MERRHRGSFSHSTRLGLLGSATVLLAGVLGAPNAGPLAAASQVPNSVALGVSDRPPPGSTVLGRLAQDQTLNLDVVLRPQDAGGLAAFAAMVATRGSSQYRHYLSPARFAEEFGAAPSATAAVEVALRRSGLTVTGTGDSGLLVRVRATAGSVDRALGVKLERYAAGGVTGYASPTPARLPTAVAGEVAGIVGLDSFGRPEPTARRTTGGGSGSLRSHLVAAASGPQPNSGCAMGGAGPNVLDITDLAKAYGYDNLYAAGDLGSGATIALIEFAPFISTDISNFESCFTPSPDPTITTNPVDGGPGQAETGGFGTVVGGEEEVELDLETLIGLAPEATIDVYEAPESESDPQVLDAFSAAIDNPAVEVISTSWGDCEEDVDPSLYNAESTLFLQAASEGKTIVAAAGDEGSEDCFGTLPGSAGRALAVDDPASQPDVTGVGGTDLTAIGPAPTESVWNGSNGAGLSGGAGGGGVSSLWQMPSYQQSAAASLGVVSSNSSCPAGTGDCREVPDVAADAGATVAIYCSESGREGCESGDWTSFGGTSVAAPTWAALFALADESAACAGSSIGFANPALYAIASGSGYAGAFNDITNGNNDLLGVHGGDYGAAPGYDLASGLGSPIVGSGSGSDGGLVSQLCAEPRSTGVASVAVTSTANTTSTTTTTTTIAPPPSPPSTVAPAPLVASAPVVSRITPTDGPCSGGTLVTVIGSGFVRASIVEFGSRHAHFTLRSSTRLVAIAPPGSGTVAVRVEYAGKTSARHSTDEFDYLAPPSVGHLAPANGSSAGGTMVTISGSGFTDVDAVRFGARAARTFSVKSSTQIVAVAPGGAGRVQVEVSNAGGTSRAGPPSLYGYRSP